MLVTWIEGSPRSAAPIMFAWSSDHARAGTWSVPEVLLDAAPMPEELAAAVGPDGNPWLVVAIRSVLGVPCGYDCKSLYLSRNCADDRLTPRLRVDDDSYPGQVESSAARIAVTPSGRVHVAWRDEARDVGPGALRHAAFDAAPAAPSVSFDLPGLLRVSKAPGLVRLAWTDARSEATGYNFYEGTIGSLSLGHAYDHRRSACGVPRMPIGAAATSVERPMPVEDAYFLIGVANCGGEGRLGSNSFGVRRPIPGAGTACGAMP